MFNAAVTALAILAEVVAALLAAHYPPLIPVEPLAQPSGSDDHLALAVLKCAGTNKNGFSDFYFSSYGQFCTQSMVNFR